MNMFPLAILNGHPMDTREPAFRAADLALNRGYGIFDFFRTLGGKPLFWEDHLERFHRSAWLMHLPMNLSNHQLRQMVDKVIAASGEQEVGVKMLLTGGDSADGYHIGSPNLLISAHSLPKASPEQYTHGIRLMTYPHRRELADAKTINYTMGIWLLPKIAEAQADDVLYYAENGVLETPRSNVFVVDKSGKVCTPDSGMLHGITRKKVFGLAAGLFPAEETEISLEALRDAQEVFITSTTKRILPVTKIDGKIIGNGMPGPITLQLSKAFAALEKAESGH